ncbi:MAG: Mut7-C RNAse domain-containing protein [Actinomycetota bacterium]|nr:Mut7-C RNAse domain-containing protein [Actinomycetota bacterium]
MRFLCDAMLGGLAKWLRAAGYDAYYAREGTDVSDGTLVRMAIEEGRVLLTSDRGFLERKAVRDGEVSLLVVPHLPLEDQLRLVAGSFDLVLLPSRCMECNGALETVRPDAVAERIPPGVIRHHRTFFRCLGCDRLFWHGSHWERIEGRLSRVFGARRETKPGMQADVLSP